MTEITAEEQQNTWFRDEGVDTDVVLSTRVRLARNLTDFPFPEHLKNGSEERVESILFDAFSRTPDAELYQTLSVKNLEELGRLILEERGVLPYDALNRPSTGIVFRDGGRISATINFHDHLHLSSFCAGFDPSAAYDAASRIDGELQKHVQFAGNLDCGYFTSSLRDAGTGMKISAVIHIPATVRLNLQERLFQTLAENGFEIKPWYALNPEKNMRSIGSWYLMNTNSCWPLSETDQIAAMTQAEKNIVAIERNASQDVMRESPTLMKDIIYRAVAAIKYSRFVPFIEGLELVSALKWGHTLNLVEGLSDGELHSLLYRIQEAHLRFVLRQEGISFEKDVVSVTQQTDRLRSIILQEAMSQVQLVL